LAPSRGHRACAVERMAIAATAGARWRDAAGWLGLSSGALPLLDDASPAITATRVAMKREAAGGLGLTTASPCRDRSGGCIKRLGPSRGEEKRLSARDWHRRRRSRAGATATRAGGGDALALAAREATGPAVNTRVVDTICRTIQGAVLRGWPSRPAVAQRSSRSRDGRPGGRADARQSWKTQVRRTPGAEWSSPRPGAQDDRNAQRRGCSSRYSPRGRGGPRGDFEAEPVDDHLAWSPFAEVSG